MISGSRKHRRHLAALQRAAVADSDTVRALSALSAEDRALLLAAGWQEPDHAQFVRINRLDIDRLPVPIR